MAIDAAALAPGWVPEDTFGDRLRSVRRQLGLHVEDIAVMCGVPLATWSTWENGARPRQLDVVVRKVAAATKCDRDWLMWGREVGAQSSPWITPRTERVEQLTLDSIWNEQPDLFGVVLPMWPRPVPDLEHEADVEVPSHAAPVGDDEPLAA
jgi:transcriptional regulator with XRE-family HTH domain